MKKYVLQKEYIIKKIMQKILYFIVKNQDLYRKKDDYFFFKQKVNNK